MLQLKGVIPALTTPFKENRSLDLGGYERLIEAVIGDGAHGLLVNGCTGESWAVTDDERAQIFATAVRTSHARVPVIAGCGSMLPNQAVEKAKQAAAAGCDAILLQPPYYILPSLEEVEQFYREVINESPLPVVLYNIPRRTGVSLTVDMVRRLSDHPKVVALKESSKDFLLLAEMIRSVGDRISVFAGYAALLGLAAITHGAVGYMDSATPVLGRKSRHFFDAVVAGDIPSARRFQSEMSQLNAGFFGVGTFPAGVKAALDMLGRPGGFPRDPIKPLDSQKRARIRAALVSAGLIQDAVRAAQ